MTWRFTVKKRIHCTYESHAKYKPWPHVKDTVLPAELIAPAHGCCRVLY